jgi:hypothetical protein
VRAELGFPRHERARCHLFVHISLVEDGLHGGWVHLVSSSDAGCMRRHLSFTPCSPMKLSPGVGAPCKRSKARFVIGRLAAATLSRAGILDKQGLSTISGSNSGGGAS